MSDGYEWGDYASQPLSGVVEALNAAGIDCVIQHREFEEDASEKVPQRSEP